MELRETQNTLVLRDKGLHLNNEQRALLNDLQRETGGENKDDNYGDDDCFPSPADKGTSSSAENSGELTYYIQSEANDAQQQQERPSGGREDELAALAIHLEQLEEENLALRERERVHMLKAVSIRDEGPNRKASLQAARGAGEQTANPNPKRMVNAAVSCDFVKNTDENTLIDLAALEQVNDMNDLQTKLEASRVAHDEERQKVWSLKQVLHQLGPLAPKHKQTLLESGIILTDGDELENDGGALGQIMRRLTVTQN